MMKMISLSILLAAAVVSKQSLAGTFDKTRIYKEKRICQLVNATDESQEFTLSLTIAEQTEQSGKVFRNVITVSPFAMPFSTAKNKAAEAVAIRQGQTVQLGYGETWVGYGDSQEDSWSRLFVGPGDANYPRTVITEDGLAQGISALKLLPFHREEKQIGVEFGSLGHLGDFSPVESFSGACKIEIL